MAFDPPHEPVHTGLDSRIVAVSLPLAGRLAFAVARCFVVGS
jgi:hypothetical protein